MATTNPAGFDLIDRLRRAELPSPGRRRRIRERAGVTQHQVATELDVSAMTVHRWEAGSDPRDLELRIRYRELLDQLDEVAP